MNTQSINGLKLSHTQTTDLIRKMKNSKVEKTYLYPWKSLEEELNQRNISNLLLAAYGSLINPASAALTFGKGSTKFFEPIIAFGARRIFNYKIPSGNLRYGYPKNKRNRAALNVRITGEKDDAINGVLMKIALEEIDGLRSREVGYDLIPIVCLWWKSMNNPPFLAYILCSPSDVDDENHTKLDQILPNEKYYHVCRDGAAKFGADFLQLWLDTTFLADGLTPVREWESNIFKDK